MWDRIIDFYQQTAQSPREGEMWDQMRYHCRKMLLLIEEIRQHPELEKLPTFINHLALRISNPASTNAVEITIYAIEIAEIRVFHIEDHTQEECEVIRVATTDVIHTLTAFLLE